MGVATASDFPIGPYPDDQITHLGNDALEYRSPPFVHGLGTEQSVLQPNSVPVVGAAVLRGEDTDLWFLAVRLPSETADLRESIIRQFERAYPTDTYQSLQTSSGARTPFAAAVGFYAALSKGDGTEAANFIVPAKRSSGPLSAGELTSFYSNVDVPLQVENATAQANGNVIIRYSYKVRGGRRCNGVSDVRTVGTSEGYLIAGIRVFNGC